MEVLERTVSLVCKNGCIINTPKGADEYRGGEILEISEESFKAEIARGKHPKTGRWISPAINHFDLIEASEEIKNLIREVAPPPKPEPEKHVIPARRGRPKKEK